MLIAQREVADELDALDLREFAERALCDFFRYIAKSPDRGCFAGLVRFEPELDDQAFVGIAHSRKGLRAAFGDHAPRKCDGGGFSSPSAPGE